MLTVDSAGLAVTEALDEYEAGTAVFATVLTAAEVYLAGIFPSFLN